MAFDTNLSFKIAAQVVGSDQVKGLTRDVTELRKSAGGIESAFKGAGNIVKGFAAAFTAQQVLSFTKSVIDLGDELAKASQRTGVGVSELSKLKTSAELAGVGFDSLQSAIRKLNNNLAEAQNGSKSAQAAFKAVGITTKEIKDLKADDALKRIADAFAVTEDGAGKVRIATELLGKSGSDLINFLNEGSAGLTKFGIEMSDQFAKDAEKFNDSMSIMKNSLMSLVSEVAGPLLPKLGLAFTFWSNRVDGFTTSLKKMSILFQSVIGDFKNFGETFEQRAARRDQFVKELRELDQGLSKRQQDRYTAFFKPDQDLTVKIKSKGIPSDELQKEREKRAKDIKKEEDALKSYLATQKQALELMQLEAEKVNLSETAYKKKQETIRYENELAKESSKFTGERLALFKQEAEEIHNQRLAMIDLQEEQERSFGAGAKSAIKSYTDEAKKSAKMMEEVFKGAFSRLEDSLVEFVKTGKFNFKDLADFIITELIRISVRQAVLAPVIGAIGSIFSGLAGGAASGGTVGGGTGTGSYSLGNSYAFANGGIMTHLGSVPLKTYARGGIANSPQLAMFGEGSTPEAYVPLPDGRRIPVAMSGQSAGANTQVSVVVNMNGDNAQGDAESNSAFGEKLGKAIVNVVRQEMIVQRRPGGLLA